MGSVDRSFAKQIIEALLFVAEKPVTVDQIQSVVDGCDKRLATDLLNEIKESCQKEDRGVFLREIAGGYQFFTKPELSAQMRRFQEIKESRHLSHASLETLSVIAYRQPVTRQEIEWIRGVNVDGALRTLLEKGLVKVAGRKEVPGRPILYGTTQEFLNHFGLPSLDSLPKLAEFTEKDIAHHLLPLEMRLEGEGSLELSSDNPTEEAGSPSSIAETEADDGVSKNTE